jgi:hypothetical protein
MSKIAVAALIDIRDCQHNPLPECSAHSAAFSRLTELIQVSNGCGNIITEGGQIINPFVKSRGHNI